MSNSDNSNAWKSEYIALLDKPTSGEANLPEAIALKIRNAPPFLYRYRKFSEYAVAELIEGYFWLSAPDAFNDPFDSALLISEEILFKKLVMAHSDLYFARPEIKALFTENEQRRIIASEDPYKTGWEIIHEKASSPITLPWEKLFRAFLNESQQATASARATRDSFLRNNLRICCFCENFSSVLMWSHYAANHTGICIQYSTEEMFRNELILSFLHPVVYKPERFDSTLHFDPTTGPDKMNLWSPSLASCHKSPDWSYEREWRLVIPPGPKGETSKFLVDIRPRRILVGVKTKHADLEKVKAIADKLSVPIMVGEVSETTFSITFK